MPKSGIKRRLHNLGPTKRYVILIVPLAILLAIPIFVAFIRDEKNTDGSPQNTIGGVDEKRFWIMIEFMWLGFWTCKAVAYYLPKAARYLECIMEPKETTYDEILFKLIKPISWVLWVVLVQIGLIVFINTNSTWKNIVQTIFKALLVCSWIVLGKELIIQKIRIRWERRVALDTEDAAKIVERNFNLLSDLHFRSTESPPANWTLSAAKSRVRCALEDHVRTKSLAEKTYLEVRKRNKNENPDIESKLQEFNDKKSGQRDPEIELFTRAAEDLRTKIGERDIDQAINELDGLLTIVVFVLCIITFATYLNPNLLGALATSATALLSLSFVFASTCQEVLGSCVFLFVKHPYDVGDIVCIETSELLVRRISLLYTVFEQAQTAEVVQTPNTVLNSLWVNNITRSKTLQEQVSIVVSSNIDIERLEKKMRKFGDEMQRKWECTPHFKIEITKVPESDKFELQCRMRYERNRVDGDQRATRRSKFIEALVTAGRITLITSPDGSQVDLESNRPR